MKRGTPYLQGYNCQIAVDGVAQVILAEAVTNQSPDQEHLWKVRREWTFVCMCSNLLKLVNIPLSL